MKTIVKCVSLLCVIACTAGASSYFIHVSDPHMDFDYQINGTVNCVACDAISLLS